MKKRQRPTKNQVSRKSSHPILRCSTLRNQFRQRNQFHPIPGIPSQWNLTDSQEFLSVPEFQSIPATSTDSGSNRFPEFQNQTKSELIPGGGIECILSRKRKPLDWKTRLRENRLSSHSTRPEKLACHVSQRLQQIRHSTERNLKKVSQKKGSYPGHTIRTI